MLIWIAVFGEVEYRGQEKSELYDLRTGEQVNPMITAAVLNAKLRDDGATRVMIQDQETGRVLLRSYPDRI